MRLSDFFSIDIIPYVTDAFYPAGELIVAEGRTNLNSLIFIESGTVKCSETQENGKVNLIAYITSPEFIGDLELVNAVKFSREVTAITDCNCKIIDLTRCRELILNDVTFLKFLCNNFAKKVVRNGRNNAASKSYPLKNRLATFILDTQNAGNYTIPHTEASYYLGVSYRHLLYVLAKFVEEGILYKSKSGYKITDIDALKNLYIIHSESPSLL